MSANNHKPQGRVMPPKYRFTIEAVFHRTFTKLERLQIAAGYDIVIEHRTYTTNSPGRCHHADMVLRTTKEKKQ